MSDPAHPPAAPSGGDGKKGDKKMPSPGTIFGLLLAVSIGGFLALSLLGQGIGSFIESIGIAKRHYPEVVMGIIALGFAIAAFATRKKD